MAIQSQTAPAESTAAPIAAVADQKCLSLAQGIPERITEFIKAKGLADVETFAVIAAVEADLKTELFDPFAADGCEIKDIGEKTAVKKLWRACRAALPTNEAGASGANTTQANDELPAEVERDINRVWLSTHGFVVPDNWLLSKSSQNSL